MARSTGTKIGLLLSNTQTRYQRCRDGVIDQLRDEGFAEPEIVITVEQADSNAERATDLARRFRAAGASLVIPIGTSAAVATAAEIKDLPVVFAFVFDPVDSKIAGDWRSSGNNTTGSSSKSSAEKLLSCLKRLAPVRKLVVLYTPDERNTVAQLHDVLALADPEVAIAAVPLRTKADIATELPKLEGNADALLLTGSSIIGESAAQIVLQASKGRIITATQSHGMESRVLLGVTVNPEAVGRLAGKKAAQVLRGALPASIEIEALKTSDVVLNLKIAKIIGCEIPEALKSEASRLLE